MAIKKRWIGTPHKIGLEKDLKWASDIYTDIDKTEGILKEPTANTGITFKKGFISDNYDYLEYIAPQDCNKIDVEIEEEEDANLSENSEKYEILRHNVSLLDKQLRDNKEKLVKYINDLIFKKLEGERTTQSSLEILNLLDQGYSNIPVKHKTSLNIIETKNDLKNYCSGEKVLNVVNKIIIESLGRDKISNIDVVNLSYINNNLTYIYFYKLHSKTLLSLTEEELIIFTNFLVDQRIAGFIVNRQKYLK